jgi:hypothetical protein
MLVFKSTVTHTRTYFLVRFALSLLLGLGLIFTAEHFDLIETGPFVWSVVTAFSIKNFIKKSKRLLINHIAIDLEKRAITFSCFQFWQGQVKFIDPFEGLKIEIVTPRPAWIYHSPLIFFFRSYPGEFYVSKRKDNFSIKTLTDLALALKPLTSPVEK